MNDKNDLRGQELLEAVGQLDDRFIEESAAPESPKKASRKIIPYASLVAVAAAVALLISPLGQKGLRSIGLINSAASESEQNESLSGMTDEHYVNSGSAEVDWAILLPWDELSDSERWHSFTLSDKEYLMRSSIPLDPSEIGKGRGKVTLVGYDEITDEKHTKKAEVFEIKNISSDCALAVLYDDGNYRAYAREYYTPKNLGQMVQDLGLKHTLKVGNVYCSYSQNGAWVTETYSGLKVGDLLSLFDEYASAECQMGEQIFNKKLINWYDISVTIEELGHRNISVAFTKDGYIQTNIMDFGKLFYIGPQRVAAFFEHIKSNCSLKTERRPVNTETEDGAGTPVQDGSTEPFYGAASSAYTGPN